MESKNVIKGNIVAKMISCNDSDHMWDHGYERPGLCPICHNVIEFIPNLEYKVRKNKKGEGVFKLYYFEIYFWILN